MSWASKLAKPYRVEDGKKFRLKDFDPNDTRDFKSEEHAKEQLEKGIQHMAELQDKLYAQDALGGAADLPGDGRGRQGRRDQARHVGRESAGLPGVFVQGAVAGGTRSRLSVADATGACRSAAASASSTARTTRKCWWCACIRRF